jgi:hypothetical protein
MRLKQYINEKKGKGKPVDLVRFGGLSPTSHKKFYKNGGTFHSPPVKKGIYAFIWPYIEDFLWVWKIPDIPNEPEGAWKKRKNEYMKKNTKRFKYSGMIWTHFVDVAPEGRRVGSWVEIHTDDLHKILKKVKHRDVRELMGDKFLYPAGTKTPIIDPYKKGLGGFMSKDHLEVFIERL